MVEKQVFTTRQIAILGLLATLWAVIEIELGLIFRAVQLPFFGVILTFCGFIVLLISRKYVMKRGTIIFVALTTAFLKLIYLGALSLLPVLAIISEGILLELFLWRVANPGRVHSIFAGILIFIWTFFYPFFALGILSGWEISRILQLIVGWGRLLLGISSAQTTIIIVVVFGLHIITGITAGVISHKIILILHKFVNPEYSA